MVHHVRMATTGSPAHPARFPYGIDAPYVPAILGAAGLVFVVVGAVAGAVWAVIVGILFLIQTAIYLHTTLRGKFRVWERLLDEAHLRGDEVLVDLGCGRGAVLVAAARRLPRGKAHGVDLWRSVDQSGNREEVTTANAATAGVADRVVLHTADMTDLPFEDATFDVVTSSLAIHNLPVAGDRDAVVAEAFRVLRPGGRLVVADIRNARQYAKRLCTLGAKDVTIRGMGPNFWFAGPWQAVSTVTGVKA